MSPEILHTNGCFGCDSLGRLTRVMVHRPGDELGVINEANYRDWLFDSVPDVAGFRAEHDAYCELLRSHGVEVLELADYVASAPAKLAYMPNITYMHDVAVISNRGAILSRMAWAGRRDEHLVVREALETLGIPIFAAFDDPQDAFEGCLLLSPRTVLVAETERHSPASIRKFIARALSAFDEVIYVKIPKARRFMHPDTVYNRITDRLALVYRPGIEAAYLYRRDAVEPVDFPEFMRARGIELVNVSDAEQRRLACSFVPLEPGVIFHYDTALDPATCRELSRRGVEIIPFHPHALHAGGGSLRCLTLRLHRTADRSTPAAPPCGSRNKGNG
ncbi:MAG: arginine deiminase family protein [Planctomycetes bacterium]|nr:arginine deiminase family protein [Planctomycetota bacterium]